MTTPPLSRFLESARRVCDGATAGPWEAGFGYHAGGSISSYVRAKAHRRGVVCEGIYQRGEGPDADAAFIAASRSLLPTALALVEKLAAYVQAYAALNCGTIDDECGSPECPVCSARATLTECAALAEKEAPR